MSQYDPSILENEVGKLYKKAASKPLEYAWRGLLVGCCFLSLLIASSPAKEIPQHWSILVPLLVPAAIGFFIGRDRARKLRVEGQMILIHVQIERNTRR